MTALVVRLVGASLFVAFAIACSEEAPAVRAQAAEGGTLPRKEAGTDAPNPVDAGADGSSSTPGDAAPDVAPLLPGRTVTIADES